MSRSAVDDDRRSSRARWLAGAGLVVSLVLAGCGSTAAATSTPASPIVMDSPQPSVVDAASPSDAVAATDSPTPAPVDVCALATMTEVAAVTGGKLQDPVPEGNPVTRCVWTAPPTGPVGQLEIDLGDGAKKAYDIDLTVLHHAFTAVPGIGDEAWAEDDAIFIRKGETWLAIHLVRLNDASANAPALVTIARLVVGRI
jgi:hypothetical protein